ncbi:MAG: mechanosensitive ion channel protein [Gammaproteobacteria bacterium BRH_c0]|nr:MAG: mechanosensitive ion channel protein [Gammaproteobacteria bacterium BRH_c0]
MDFQHYKQSLIDMSQKAIDVLLMTETYAQLGLVLAIFGFAYVVANRIRHYIPVLATPQPDVQLKLLQRFFSKLGNLIFPLLTILILSIVAEISAKTLGQSWLLQSALIVAMLLVFNALIRDHVKLDFLKFVFRWVGLPLLFLHLVGLLAPLIEILESLSVTIGNIEVSMYGVLRVTLFGSLLFWLGRVSNSTGKEIIRRQEKLDFRTREVAAKLLEVAIFLIIFLLLLQVMGINLTALAVFGGALGVGLGFGLQAIASNFISGIIILLDRSISVDDYIELEDGRTGIVRELTLRSTTLETFDGKDIMVPNEKFMTESFTNWTHKDKKQRYRVDFSVAYHSDVRKLVEIIKEVVASHEQVISGPDIPFEERPDCEIDSFGDSGINMFVEFWMYGIDDGKNRVGGDLLLMILETLQEHGFEIPFPQREVRILNNQSGK